MKEWRAEYKCRRCGAIDRSLCGAKEVCQAALIHAVVAESRGAALINFGIPMNMLSTHLCEDGGSGVTDLIGVACD